DETRVGEIGAEQQVRVAAVALEPTRALEQAPHPRGVALRWLPQDHPSASRARDSCGCGLAAGARASRDHVGPNVESSREHATSRSCADVTISGSASRSTPMLTW